MNEQEEMAFRIAYQFYRKWREVVIETDEQWKQFAADVGEMGLKVGENVLAWNLIGAVLDTFTALYQDGMKPMPAGYLGRDDI